MGGVEGQRRSWAPIPAALGFALICATPALGDEPKLKEPDTVLFANLDVGRTGYGTIGFKRSWPGALDRSGFATLGAFGYGGAPETFNRATGARAYRHKASASLLAGYQWVRPGLVIAGFVGPELDYEREPGFAGSMARPDFGLRAQGELWAHPTQETLLTSTVVAGSARDHLWARVSGGYQVWSGVFLGPEAVHYRRDDYREWRLGAHATGLAWRGVNARLSAGVASFDERAGGYVGLTMFTKY